MSLLLIINSTPVTVYDNVSVVLNSPVFNDQGTEGSYIFNFNIPLSNELKQNIGFLNNPASLSKDPLIDVQIISPVLNFNGQAKIVSVDTDSIEISIPVENGMLAEKLKKFSLRDLQLEQDIQAYESYSRASASCGKIRNQNYSFSDESPLVLSGIFSPVNFGSLAFFCPLTQSFTLDIELRLKIYAGENVRLAIYKTVGTYTSLINEFSILRDESYFGYFDSSNTKILTTTLSLNLNDIISFKILADSEHFPQYTQLQNRMYFSTHGDKSYVNFTFNSSIDEITLGTAEQNVYPNKKYTFFPVYNPSFYNNAPESKFVIDDLSLFDRQELFPVVNYYKNGRFPIYITGQENDTDERYYSYNTIVPFPYLAYIVEKIFEFADIEIAENAFSHNRFKGLCLVSMNAINIFDRRGGNPVPPEFSLADHLPDVNASVFLSDVCQSLGIIFQYDHLNKTVDIITLESILTDNTSSLISDNIIQKPSLDFVQYDGFKIEYGDSFDCSFRKSFIKSLSEINYLGEKNTFSLLPLHNTEINDCWFVEDVGLFYYWNYNNETEQLSWMVYSLNFHLYYQEMFYGSNSDKDNTFVYSLPISPLMDVQHPSDDPCFGADRKWLIPAFDAEGNMISISRTNPYYGLTFYRGQQLDSKSNPYPLGTNGFRTFSGGGTHFMPCSLRIDDYTNNSLYKFFLEKYIKWRSKTEGEYKFLAYLTAQELINFRFISWYNIRGVDYLIKEIQYELSGDGLYLASIAAVSRLERQTDPPPPQIFPEH